VRYLEERPPGDGTIQSYLIVAAPGVADDCWGPCVSDEKPQSGEVILYQTADALTRVQCRFVENTLWLSQALSASCFRSPFRL
jgi:hypothetical protein